MLLEPSARVSLPQQIELFDGARNCSASVARSAPRGLQALGRGLERHFPADALPLASLSRTMGASRRSAL